MLSISYLVTCHNEDRTLKNLLERLVTCIDDTDEILILDDFSDNAETRKILTEYASKPRVHIHGHSLNRNYGAHKNYGASLCKGQWVFQLDGDELPSEILLINLKDIIELNPEVDVFAVPRINDFKGVTEAHARQWGWGLTPCPVCDNRLIVQWPDFQGRVYRNDPTRIKWDRRLHEKLEGHKKFLQLPPDYELAIYHDKTIETQIKTNIRYNEWFSQEENKGHGGWNR
jgi:glycosyltransferase involved in cell wall biosynthesis